MYAWGRQEGCCHAYVRGAWGNGLDGGGAALRQVELEAWAWPSFFRECTHRFLIDFPLSAYHGKGAQKKTLYCGKYRVDHDFTYEESFKQMPACTKECICELEARRELRGGGGDGEGGGGSDGLGEGSGQLERRASRANEIMSRLEEEDEVFTMCSVEFVEYDEKRVG